MRQHFSIVPAMILLMVVTSSIVSAAPGATAHTSAPAFVAQDDSPPRVLPVPWRRRLRARRDRRRSRGIGAAYSRAGREYARGGKRLGRGGARFGKNLGRGRPIVAGRELGRGAGGFGKGVGKGSAQVGVGTARVGKRVGKRVGGAVRRVF